MTINVGLEWVFFVPILLFLLYKLFKPREKSYGYLSGLDAIPEIIYFFLLVAFILIWGGIFWW